MHIFFTQYQPAVTRIHFNLYLNVYLLGMDLHKYGLVFRSCFLGSSKQTLRKPARAETFYSFSERCDESFIYSSVRFRCVTFKKYRLKSPEPSICVTKPGIVRTQGCPIHHTDFVIKLVIRGIFQVWLSKWWIMMVVVSAASCMNPNPCVREIQIPTCNKPRSVEGPPVVGRNLPGTTVTVCTICLDLP